MSQLQQQRNQLELQNQQFQQQLFQLQQQLTKNQEKNDKPKSKKSPETSPSLSAMQKTVINFKKPVTTNNVVSVVTKMKMTFHQHNYQQWHALNEQKRRKLKQLFTSPNTRIIIVAI